MESMGVCSTWIDTHHQCPNLREDPKCNRIWKLAFSDVSSLIRLSAQRSVELNDIWSTTTSAEDSFHEFEKFWAEERANTANKRKPKVRRAIFRLARPHFWRAVAFSGMSALIKFIGPMFLNQILKIITYRQRNYCDGSFPATLTGPMPPVFDFGSEEYLCKESAGYIFGGLLFLSLFLAAFFQNHSQNTVQLAALKVRAAMIAAAYNKTLRLSNVGMTKIGAGMVNNVCANDAEQLLLSSMVFPMVVWAPFQIALSLILLESTIGTSFLAGFGGLVILGVASFRVLSKGAKYKALQVKETDRRVKLTSELLNASRIVKAYGWEQPFEEEVTRIRYKETMFLRSYNLLLSVASLFMTVSPAVLAVATFSTYAATGNDLNAHEVFTAIAVMNILRMPMGLLPLGISEMIKVNIAMGRLQAVIEAPELLDGGRSWALAKDGSTVVIDVDLAPFEDAEFGYMVEDTQDKGKGKDKGENKGGGCTGFFAKLGAGKGKGKGKGTGKGGPSGGKGGTSKSEVSDEGKTEEIDQAALVEVKHESGELLKMRRAIAFKSFEVVQGGLTIVVGPVGSGKSSLLAALLGETELIKGTRVDLSCRVAYAAQCPWIINTSVEGNIKFGEPDRGEDHYHTVLAKCCIFDDLDIMPAGDQTEIGERGVNLSGGQRARIALARALYCDAGVYMFDDPLAAVDAHVGKKLFDGICDAKGILADKTRILVTHQLQYLPMADRIVVLEQGQVVACGTYKELAVAGGCLEHLADSDPSTYERTDAALTTDPLADDQADHKNTLAGLTLQGKANLETRRSLVGMNSDSALSLVEEKQCGSAGWATYKAYFAKGWGLHVVALFTLAHMLCGTSRVMTDFWLADWVENTGLARGVNLEASILIYIGLAMLQACMIYLKSTTTMVVGTIRSSRRLCIFLFRSVFGAPTVWFDVTPVGRILNRFTADLDTMDNQLSRALMTGGSCLESTLSYLVAIIIIQPLVVTFALPAGVVYFFVSRYYVNLARDIQRLESVSKTPIFNRISETLNGLPVIRAFGYQHIMLRGIFRELTCNQACHMIRVKASSWLALRLELASCSITTACAIFAILPSNIDNQNAALAGVSLSYGLELSQYMQMLARMTTEFEQRFVSVERVVEFLDLPRERAAIVPADAHLPAAWPARGSIEYRDVTMRYREGLEPALRGLSFLVEAGEKLGIVGRTGSGKSSIMVSLLRLTECEAGEILIDGENVGRMGLQKLRQSLSMIPQEPVLFGSTTIRRNLDPFDQYTDDVVRAALVNTRMDGKDRLQDGLDTEVAAGGDSFSVGERQLLCLARALLRHSRIILLDEATASVDGETDDLIQQTIRIAFKECTVLCIAHRISTIMDSDKVLVMGQGACIEYGPPGELLRNRNSSFRGVCIKSDIEVPPLDDESGESGDGGGGGGQNVTTFASL